MKHRYQHADANLYSHIKTLRIIAATLVASLLIALLGWHHTARIQRVSIAPELRYGGHVALGEIHPWEVYNFAGYIWQQVNLCNSNCLEDFPNNLDRLTAFISPSFNTWLRRDNASRSAELSGRTRYILPLPDSTYASAVINETSNSWHVVLDVELHEHIDGVLVKKARVRFSLRVVFRPVDPENNPWGLLLDGMTRPPERIA